ncbi:MAG: NAD(+)/NADH kinase [Abditibacteriota bacterium]|nr:NAD(+)/NADH kinase [Abditibacteriota bacterium]MBP5737752.1 NAD(+)/NADH kinase [Abditibacteriota bacterium]
MRKISLAPNPERPEAVKLTEKLILKLEGLGIEVFVTERVAAMVNRPDLGVDESEIGNSDMVVVMGGDGTMLRWCRLTAPRPTPILGINFGKYGFITEVTAEDADKAMDEILAGKYIVCDRSPLIAKIIKENEAPREHFAFNDVVVSRSVLSRVIELDTRISGRHIVNYAADGLIISTPVGSTGYALSAGGPVVHPDINVFVITPICPHTLNARPLVLPTTEYVTVQPITDTNVMVTVDGQTGETLTKRDKVEVRPADFKAKFVLLNRYSFYDKLRNRLRWGERFSH